MPQLQADLEGAETRLAAEAKAFTLARNNKPESFVLKQSAFFRKRLHRLILDYLNSHKELLIFVRSNDTESWCSVYKNIVELLLEILLIFCTGHEENRLYVFL